MRLRPTRESVFASWGGLAGATLTKPRQSGPKRLGLADEADYV